MVHFFVTVPINSGNVATAWVDASSLGLAGNITLNDADHDGTFTSTAAYLASYGTWNGRTVIFSVSDSAGNVVTGQFTVIVIPVLPPAGQRRRKHHEQHPNFVNA